MNETTTNEVSALFQELIVSKIKEDIDLLKKEMDEKNSELCEKVEKIPKMSRLQTEFQDIKILMQQISSDTQTTKLLNDIIENLKKQYAFTENKTLCQYVEEMGCLFSCKIDDIINNQEILDKKIVDLYTELEKVKKTEADSYSRVNALLEKCQETEKESVLYLVDLKKDVGDAQIALNTIIEKEDNLVKNQNNDTDLLKKIDMNIGYGSKEETVKLEFNNINSLLQNVLKYCKEQELNFATYIESEKNNNKKRNLTIGILCVLNIFSVICVIILMIVKFV